MTTVIHDEPGTADPVNAPPGPRKAGRLRGRRRFWPLMVPLLALLLVFFVYPTVTMLLRSFTQFRPPQLGGLDNFIWFFETDANVTILVRTLTTALLCTAVALLLAFPFAYTMTLVSPTVRTLLTAAVLISMFAGILLRNFAWIVLLQKNGLINEVLGFLGLPRQSFLGSTTAVVIGMTHVLFPYMVLPLYTVLRGIDRRLVLAAESLGASPFKAFWQVYVPLSVPGVFAGSVLVFVLGLGFFITPALLGSPQQAMVSQLMILQFDRVAAFGRAGAIAVILLVITLLVVGIVRVATSRSRGYETS
ncbi:ABC transporter permease [Amycolatopsis jejuensis]|uniref:ABC transporter permease n=1 Tax=Amycolatopsis jejuensis TaxID=330084 RepID=UPI0006914C0D|nr:ABC transporter permease [Amycolatopsis jejuensis]